MRFSFFRPFAAVLVALLLAVPVLAAPVGPATGPQDGIGKVTLHTMWSHVTRLWDELLTRVVAGDGTITPPPDNGEGPPSFDPDGFTALSPEVGGGDGGPVAPLL